MEGKQVSFDKIWKSVLNIDIITGSFLFGYLSKWTFKARFFRYITIILFGFLITLLYGIIYSEKFSSKILSWIIFGAMLQLFCTVFNGISIMWYNKRKIRIFFIWCEYIYDDRWKFHPEIQEIVREKSTWIHKLSIKMIVILRTMTYFEFVGVLAIIPIIGYFLPDHIYAKFQLFMPLYLPVKNQNNWTVFLVTYFMQLIVLMESVSMGQLIWGVILLILLHIYGYLLIIENSINLMRQSMVEYIEEDSHILMVRSKDSLTFDMWLKIIVDMLCNVKQTINSVNKIFSPLFLLFELTAISSIFIASFLIVVIKEQQLFGIAVLFNVVTFFILCLIAKIIEDKFSDIYNKLYDLPWYNLTVKEQKLFLQMITYKKNHAGFTSGGLHVINLQRFTTVLERGYANFLVLKDIVAA